MVGSAYGSIGIHSDDGAKYAQGGCGEQYGESIYLRDTVGCNLEVRNGKRTVSFFINNEYLGK